MTLIHKSLWIDSKRCLVNNESSFYLQSKVYFAKEFLMQDHPVELNVSKYNPDQDGGEEAEAEQAEEGDKKKSKEEKKEK
mmetsp:Transcript_4767/g.4498  ORF Transcript_4767/g.4498 Transcript_4767/m.4498 type:complete len:80 (-) Transcript_4767:25-264(-)